MNAINQAIDIIGGQTELAKHLGTSVQAVNNWTRRGSVPPEYAPVIEVLTDRKIKADDMCSQVPWRLVRGTEAA